MEARYSLDAYNKHLSLKVPWLLALTMLFAMRHAIIVFLAYNPHPKLGSAFVFLRPLAEPWFLITDIPAALLMMAWSERVPEARNFWRRIWPWGRILLTATLGSQFALLAAAEGQRVWNAYVLLAHERIVVVSLSLNLLFLYYLWRSARVGDVFRDFPPAAAADKS